ncbi:MAG: hypothetical protein BJ554DRAFT_156 [Olpidium bornovanus]|uniref:Uncharacterized protein n=1 Tax=Olpidium bornovanus TaxID=278681 RepID=A0A8H8DIC6_9FUNG|nr:MAG: hypothetical protein BJ554DRAFT_156 [Olpidium bornovanus]
MGRPCRYHCRMGRICRKSRGRNHQTLGDNDACEVDDARSVRSLRSVRHRKGHSGERIPREAKKKKKTIIWRDHGGYGV